jgi:tetratricopeptide (TPR) repeat protein
MHMKLSQWSRGLFLVAGFGVAAAVLAAPFLPTNDAQVLERLPSRSTPQFRDLKTLQAAAASAPGDLTRALALATAYIRASRVEGDPRFLGYAQAALAPWWKDPEAPARVLVLRATILQSSHQFAAAQADLDRVLQREPRNVQAILTRATILTVQGDFAAARPDCQRLDGLAPPIYRVICLAAIDSVTGKAGTAYDALQAALQSAPRVDDAGASGPKRCSAKLRTVGVIPPRSGTSAQRLVPATRTRICWVRIPIGCSIRIDRLTCSPCCRARAATTRCCCAWHWRSTRSRGPKPPRRSRYCVRASTRAMRVATPCMRGRMHASSCAAERCPAHPYALDNWKVQREPADLRILAEAAAAANDVAALKTVQRWLAETGIEYPVVAALASGKESPK